MKSFKVGDRVRIVDVDSCDYLKEATVLAVDFNRRTQRRGLAKIIYALCVDGVGRIDPMNGLPIGFEPEYLEPLINPDELAWIAFRDLHLKPDPALILAKEAV